MFDNKRNTHITDSGQLTTFHHQRALSMYLDFFGSGTKPNFGTTGERECKSANYDEAKLRAYRDPGALIT